MSVRDHNNGMIHSLEAAFDAFCDEWFSGNPIDPATFCNRHSHFGSELRGQIEGFLIAAKGIKDVGENGFGSHDIDSSVLRPGGTLGDFRIIREIGQGGMGIVYEAEQLSLCRPVALKVLHPTFNCSRKAVKKFKREALAGGRQHHPGIVTVHAMGEHEGVYFIVQELVEGGFTLADRLEEIDDAEITQPSYLEKTAGLIKLVADALAHAHDSGVIHRDVKPSNILITKEGRAKVTDFGLAKLEDALTLSRTGDLVGTPFYMSPEQVASSPKVLDSRTDIYSLGVTLYEALTRNRPFEGKTSHDVMKKIVFHEPKDPRKLNPAISRDLAVITLHAMEKIPEKRYQTMVEFSGDLQRYLEVDVIHAKPSGLSTRLVRRLKRNPWATGVLVLSVLLLATMAYLWGSLQWKDRPLVGKPDKSSPVVWSDGHTGQFVTFSEFSPDGHRILTAGGGSAFHLWDAYTLEHLNGFAMHGEAPLLNAFSPDGESILLLDTTSGLAVLKDGRSGENLATLKSDNAPIRASAFSTDGSLIVTGDNNGRVLFWEWDGMSVQRRPEPVIDTASVSWIEFNGNGDRVLTLCEDGRVHVWDVRSGDRRATLGDDDYHVESAFFGQDGKQVIGYDGQNMTLLLWNDDMAEGYQCYRHDHGPYGKYPRSISLLKNLVSPDGRRMVTVDEGQVRLWNLNTAELQATLIGNIGEFSPDGNRLVTLSADFVLRLWDAYSGTLIKACNDPAEHRVQLHRFSPDGKWIAAIHRTDYYPRGQTAWLWDGKTGDLIGECKEGMGTAMCLTFSPSGDRLAKSGYGMHVGLWETGTNRFLGRLMSHSRQVQRFIVSQSGPRVLTAPSVAYPHEEKCLTAWLWNLRTGEPIRSFNGFTWALYALALSPDETLLAIGGRDRNDANSVLKLYDVATGEMIKELVGHSYGISYALFSPGGDRIISLCYRDETARLWDVSSGRMVKLFEGIHRGGSEADIPRPMFSPDGKYLALSHADDTTKIYDSLSGEVLIHTISPGGKARFSPDGKLLTIVRGHHLYEILDVRGISIWDTESWEQLCEIENRATIWNANFSPDGRWLVTGSAKGEVKVWDVQELVNDVKPEPLTIIEEHPEGVSSVAFSLDSRRILTAGMDKAVLWCAHTWEKLHELKGHSSRIWKAVFTHDGKHIVTGGSDATIRIWNANDGKPLLTRVEYENGNWLAFEPQYGYYIGTNDAAEWARIRLNDRLFPLSSYASIFSDPGKVMDSLAAKPVESQLHIPTAPDLYIASPQSGFVRDRSFMLEAEARDQYGIKLVTVNQDGQDIPVQDFKQALSRDPGGRRVRLSLALSISEDRTETVIKVRAQNLRGILSKQSSVLLRYGNE